MPQTGNPKPKILSLWLIMEVDLERLQSAGFRFLPENLRHSFEMLVEDWRRELHQDPAFQEAVWMSHGFREE